MKLILKNATIIDGESSFNNKTADIKIENGTITAIENNLADEKGFQTIIYDNLHVSQGWFDSSVNFGEPGYEDRETIANGLETAAKSGFTDIALQPDTYPVLDSQQGISFVVNKSKGFASKLHPIGALTKKSEGNDIAEMFDMKNAGAIGFGDYKKPLENANLLKIALQYAQDFNGLVITDCLDQKIKGKGVVHEGEVSTQLGLKGIPSLAEDIQVARNLFLLEYTGGRLHIPTISTEKSVQLIKEAKAKGLNVTCSVAVHNLILTDEKLIDFDTRYKVMPPLRNEDHRKALIKGILDGTIDMITSDHSPIDIEYKKMEFDLSQYGTIGLESVFGALNTILPLEVIIEKLTSGKKVFNINSYKIEKDNHASLTLFNPSGERTFSKNDILSKSKNSAFLGQPLKGSVYGIYNQEKLILNNNE